MSSHDGIVGPEVVDQQVLRPQATVRDLAEFLDFLAQIEAVFGRFERQAGLTTGEHFLL